MMATPDVLDAQMANIDERQQPYRPIIDGEEFIQPPLQFFQSTDWNTDKKILIGFTSEEFAIIKEQANNIPRNQFFVSKNKLQTIRAS